MTTPLHEQLRDAADACTPSPLQDLLRRAADAVEVKQEPVAWMAFDSEYGGCVFAKTATEKSDLEKRGFSMVPLYTHPAPIPDGMVLVPVDPTLEMQHAYFSIIDANMDRVQTDATFGRYANNRLAYQAMLKAAGESHE